LVSFVHKQVSAADGFMPAFMASTRAFNSGCTLVSAISKKWTNGSDHLWALAKCSEVLTWFAPHWKGGRNYLEVWRIIMKGLDDQN